MRAMSRSLGLYVPGMGDFIPMASSDQAITSWRPSLGDFVGAFSDPNSLAAGITDWMPATGMGDFVGTMDMYPIPENPVMADADQIYYSGGLTGLGDCGCGCGGSCSDKGGMSGITTDFSQMVTDLSAGNWSSAWTDFTSMLSEPVIGTVPLWMIGGGALLVYALFFSGGRHSRYQRGRRASAAARSAYA